MALKSELVGGWSTLRQTRASGDLLRLIEKLISSAISLIPKLTFGRGRTQKRRREEKSGL